MTKQETLMTCWRENVGQAEETQVAVTSFMSEVRGGIMGNVVCVWWGATCF